MHVPFFLNSCNAVIIFVYRVFFQMYSMLKCNCVLMKLKPFTCANLQFYQDFLKFSAKKNPHTNNKKVLYLLFISIFTFILCYTCFVLPNILKTLVKNFDLKYSVKQIFLIFLDCVRCNAWHTMAPRQLPPLREKYHSHGSF